MADGRTGPAWPIPLLAAGLLGACQTAGTFDFDAYTKWQPISLEESRVAFVGENRPVVISTELRWYQDDVRQERVKLLSFLSGANRSQVFVSFADPAVSRMSHEGLERQARRNLCWGAEVGTARDGTNVNGPFTYVTCSYSHGEHCVLAKQGIGPVPGKDGQTSFRASAEWFFCFAKENEAENLARFATLRIKE